MVDCNGYTDLQEHFTNSLAIINQVSEYERRNHHLQFTVDKLTLNTAVSKESEQKLLQQLHTLSKGCEDGLNVLYIKLKEQHAELQCKYNQLEQTKLDLQEKFTLAKNKIVEDYHKQIQFLEEKINEQNANLLQDENTHYNQLEAQQASADLRFDDMQSQLQLQLNDATSRLREANNSCNVLREELLIFKSRSNTSMEAANKRIQGLEKELRLTQQQLHITQEKLYKVTTKNKNNREIYSDAEDLYQTNVNYERQTIDSDSSSMLRNKPTATNIINNKIVMYNNEPSRSLKPLKQNHNRYTSNKYNPLNQDASSSKEIPERLIENKTAQKHFQNRPYEGSALKKNEYKVDKPLLPPLRQVSNAKTNHKDAGGLKKRKLYNPDNLDYFDNFVEQE